MICPSTYCKIQNRFARYRPKQALMQLHLQLGLASKPISTCMDIFLRRLEIAKVRRNDNVPWHMFLLAEIPPCSTASSCELVCKMCSNHPKDPSEREVHQLVRRTFESKAATV